MRLTPGETGSWLMLVDNRQGSTWRWWNPKSLQTRETSRVLCAATFTPLHLVGKLGFRTDDKAVRRAGLDYWGEVELRHHLNIEALHGALPDCRFLYFTTKAELAYTDFRFAPLDCLVFGRETRGLREELLGANWDRCLTIPMANRRVRSLNLATAVGIVLYEAIRQTSNRGQ